LKTRSSTSPSTDRQHSMGTFTVTIDNKKKFGGNMRAFGVNAAAGKMRAFGDAAPRQTSALNR